MKTRTKTRTIPKTPFFAAFSVGAVLFSAHAGGGFATGNQANTYYVGLGWAGIVSAIVAMLLLTLTMREAMIMYNSRGLTSYKQLFETLYHPFDKIEWLFEIFFYIMVLMAVAAAISGAVSALRSYFGVNYYLGVVAVGCLVLLLTIFGAGIVRAASTYMGIAILVTAITIYAIGIFKSESPLFTVLSADFRTTGFANVPKAIFNAFTYAGFQCVTLPTMIACGTTMRSKQGCAKAMWISFAMNAVALVLSVFMLICWRGIYTAVDGGTTIPTLTVCNAMGIRALTAVYGVCLMLCLISTGVTTIFGFVARRRPRRSEITYYENRPAAELLLRGVLFYDLIYAAGSHSTVSSTARSWSPLSANQPAFGSAQAMMPRFLPWKLRNVQFLSAS